jgi:hypothetical protein
MFYISVPVPVSIVGALEEQATRLGMTRNTLCYLAVARMMYEVEQLEYRDVPIIPTRQGWRTAVAALNHQREDQDLPPLSYYDVATAYYEGKPYHVVLPYSEHLAVLPQKEIHPHRQHE